ncbi:MAG: RNA 2',3'-cyclic phosphodiesterase [Bacteroidota bacterium]|nr:RNA 2',3'-cyclic phosphodiesterase [Bacteroidota bacterium]
MRIFIGIQIGEELIKQILKWEDRHQTLLRKIEPGADIFVRWLKPENLHITVIPPWDTEDIESVKNNLEQINKIGAFEIMFDYVSYGPKIKHPRLIWTGGQTHKKFLELKSNLEDITGIKDNHQETLIHLTLARFKEPYFKKISSAKINENIIWKDIVSEITLFQSFPGSEYKILKKIPFG